VYACTCEIRPRFVMRHPRKEECGTVWMVAAVSYPKAREEKRKHQNELGCPPCDLDALHYRDAGAKMYAGIHLWPDQIGCARSSHSSTLSWLQTSQELSRMNLVLIRLTCRQIVSEWVRYDNVSVDSGRLTAAHYWWYFLDISWRCITTKWSMNVGTKA